MMTYHTMLNRKLDTISPEDENFIGELLEVAKLFRPFSVALDAFIRERGYEGELSDIDEKVTFLKGKFEAAGMTAPREMKLWYTEEQPVRRETAFQICFAFGLDGMETDDFFQRVYARERSFDCHLAEEAVYYFCLNHGLGYPEAQSILKEVPERETENAGSTVVYTESIIKALNGLETRDELVEWLKGNMGLFTANNATAYRMIRQMWEEAAGPEGMLEQERRRFYAAGEDAAAGKSGMLKAGEKGVKTWDAYLAIFQLRKEDVSRLKSDRSIKPILAFLHSSVRDSFPDRQGIDLIRRGEHISYERVRKWLVLLTFYCFWARRALKAGNYEEERADRSRCVMFMNKVLTDAGYSELYVGNPYDWIFLYSAGDREPLRTFREIWNELLEKVLE